VSNFGSARVHGAARSAVMVAAAFALSLIASAATPDSAAAQEIEIGSCVASWGALGCTDYWGPPSDPFIRLAPQPVTPEDQARAKERDRHWVYRCRPSIKQDRYGVPRYYYAMPGCDFGVGEY
jgi:hypothetical protein